MEVVGWAAAEDAATICASAATSQTLEMPCGSWGVNMTLNYKPVLYASYDRRGMAVPSNSMMQQQASCHHVCHLLDGLDLLLHSGHQQTLPRLLCARIHASSTAVFNKSAHLPQMAQMSSMMMPMMVASCSGLLELTLASLFHGRINPSEYIYNLHQSESMLV